MHKHFSFVVVVYFYVNRPVTAFPEYKTLHRNILVSCKKLETLLFFPQHINQRSNGHNYKGTSISVIKEIHSIQPHCPKFSFWIVNISVTS